MMRPSSLHKIIGVVLVLPLLGWSLTGIVFLTKPGYNEAYEQLAVKMYPLEKTFDSNLTKNWEEAKYFRTILGYHLLLSGGGTVRHIDPITDRPRELPSETDVERLVEDAIAVSLERYGDIVEISGSRVTTSTGVEITLHWSSMSLAQSGRDTRLIDNLYKIHYLQWSGRPTAGHDTGCGRYCYATTINSTWYRKLGLVQEKMIAARFNDVHNFTNVFFPLDSSQEPFAQ